MAAGILYMASGCGEADTGAERYTIVYDLNYEGGGERRVTAQEGAKIVDWQAPRDGYDFTGWYTDAQTSQKFSFPSTVSSDLTLYA